MTENLREANADQENRETVKPDSYPLLMFVDVSAFNERGEVTQFRGLRPGPYGLDQDPI